jgi:hypothetical protein
MLLAARALGLGAILATLYLQFEKEAEAALGLPPGVHSYALLPIGYPMGRFGPVRRVPPPVSSLRTDGSGLPDDKSQGGDYACSGVQMALALAGAEPHRGAYTRIEAGGFAGIWVGDSLGHTLDPLTKLAALAAVTATLRDSAARVANLHGT